MKFESSEGGLATGLNSVFQKCESLWIGWPGAVVPESEQADISRQLKDLSLQPVYLSEKEVAGFYEGFSNETLWPLFHYFPSYSIFREQYWDVYVEANRRFADAIVATAEEGDIIWVHDYQLMLVPQMVRAQIPDILIGYFHHIPFPDYEIFRALPWKQELIEGVLGADIIGFQTKEDARYFRNSTERICGLSYSPEGFQLGKRQVIVQNFPIGIDYEKFRALAAHDTTDEHVQRIHSFIPGKIALSVDRLDYSKGILQRLKAYEHFLNKHPEWHAKLSFVHIIVPSRDTVSNYKELKIEMDRLIGCINGKYAKLGWQPIHHYYQSFDPHMLTAFYKSADMAVVTPLRDGMNLVSKEYIAANGNGILLLSEAAGAAHELQDALLLNPNDTVDFSNKILQALTLTCEEKQQRMGRMQQVIAKADIFRWANSFISRLVFSVRKKRQKGLLITSPETALKVSNGFDYINNTL